MKYSNAANDALHGVFSRIHDVYDYVRLENIRIGDKDVRTSRRFYNLYFQRERKMES